jgi:hypothetical protein
MNNTEPATIYAAILNEALEAGAFGELDQEEETLLRLRSGGDDPPRTIEEVAVKTGQPEEWLGLVEQALVERLDQTPWWPSLSAARASL